MSLFSEYNLSPALFQAITDLKYETPSPIQAQTLPILLGEPTDFLGLAATGTGKTAAFSIPLLEKIDTSLKQIQALVLCPTRELALQVTEQIQLLGQHKKIKTLCVYGGANYVKQIQELRQGHAQVIVGTPGRLIDHLDRGTLSLENVKTLVLDEADEMISMGFKEELETILKSISRDSANIWFFSATMSAEVRRVANEYLRSPRYVQVNRTEMVPTAIQQIFYRVRESQKPEVLCKIIENAENFYGLVFCQTKSLVADLTSNLTELGYKVDCLHGDKDQKSRERTMQAFRDKKVNILICTDVASRGLDVKDITHVINYSLPREIDSYVHRIGRTARSGKTGFAMSLVSPSHLYLLSTIEKKTKSKMVEGRLPSRKDIATKKVKKALEMFDKQVHFSRALDLLDDSWKKTLAQSTPEEVASRFLMMMFPSEFAVFQDAPKSVRFSELIERENEPPRKATPPLNRRPSRPKEHRRGEGGRSNGYGKSSHRSQSRSPKKNKNQRSSEFGSYFRNID